MDTMTTESNKRTRRDYSRELKAQILAQCAVPGASVAKVAMSHGINSNLVHGWRKLERERGEAAAAAVQQARAIQPRLAATNPCASAAPFVPVTVMPAEGGCIEIEVRRGTVTMKVNWPLSEAAHCAAWVRELLK